MIQFDLIIEEGQKPTLDSTIGSIQQDAWSIVEEGGQSIVQDAKALVPVRTGALRESIYFEILDVTGLVIGATMGYAPYVEYGTPRMSARPFLEEAINLNQETIQTALDNMIADHLNEDNPEEDPELEFNVEMDAVGAA